MKKRIAFTLLAATMTLGTAAGIQALAHGSEVHQPAQSEFGFGPRASAQRLYSVTMQPVQELRLRQLQTVRVRIEDTNRNAVDGAVIAVDGGMPQHGHGLPTQPRVTKALGDGVYEIEGVRFSMGGWWEFKLAIQSSAGADNVTFNLSL